MFKIKIIHEKRNYKLIFADKWKFIVFCFFFTLQKDQTSEVYFFVYSSIQCLFILSANRILLFDFMQTYVCGK